MNEGTALVGEIRGQIKSRSVPHCCTDTQFTSPANLTLPPSLPASINSSHGSPPFVRQHQIDPLWNKRLSDSLVSPSSLVHSVSLTPDSPLSLKSHINNQPQNISIPATSVASDPPSLRSRRRGLATSRLDYCNSLLCSSHQSRSFQTHIITNSPSIPHHPCPAAALQPPS